MIKEREKSFKLIQDLRLNKKCVITNENDNKTLGKFIVKERMGTESVFGEVYNACSKNKKGCDTHVSIKRIPLENKEYNDVLNKKINKSAVLTEMKILSLVNGLVKNNINPNLPIVFKYFLCDDGKFRDNIDYTKKIDKYAFIVNEKAEGDLVKFITKIKPDLLYIINAYFQIFTAIYCLQKYFNFFHNDLHWGNVLFQKINNQDKGTKYITYKLSDKLTITIKNMGYLFTLWDFGLSFIPNRLTLNKSKKKLNWKTDYKRIISMLSLDSEQKSQDYDDLGKDMMYVLNNSENALEFLENIKTRYNLHEGVEKTDYVYNMTKKICPDNKQDLKYIVKDMKKC